MQGDLVRIDMIGQRTKRLLRNARLRLRMTQGELAKTLRISVRAVQSYEQGWRTLPVPLTVHLLTLLAVHAGHADVADPCWTLTGCQPDTRRDCPSYRITGGRFCWLVAGDVCGGRVQPPDKAMPRCLACPVTARLTG